MKESCEGKRIHPGKGFCRQVNDAKMYANSAKDLETYCDWTPQYVLEYLKHLGDVAEGRGCTESCQVIHQIVAQFQATKLNGRK